MIRRSFAVSAILSNRDISQFEKTVYCAVLSIPKGEVRSYKWVAAAIGKPKACRAVGNALNKNPWPVEVPCHRVIRSDGSLGGYYKGSALKKRMLIREGSDS